MLLFTAMTRSNLVSFLLNCLYNGLCCQLQHLICNLVSRFDIMKCIIV